MFFEKSSRIKLSKGFTLAEALITLGVIGVIAALTMPQLHKGLPKQEEKLHEKITYTLEQTVANMFEDEQMYPKLSDDLKEGFQNTDKVFINGVPYGSNSSTDPEKNKKFCKLFASKFKKRSRFEYSGVSDMVLCTASASNPSTATSGPSFITTDGAFWYVPITDFSGDGYAKITVDVNGKKAPNKTAASSSNPDRFEYYIKFNGTITEDSPTASSSASRAFKLTINKTTKDRNNQVVTPAYYGGGVRLFQCDAAGESCTKIDESLTKTEFNDLQRGVVYRVDACSRKTDNATFQCPGPTVDLDLRAYTSNWSGDKKTFKITNKDMILNLTFNEIPTSTVELVVSGCPDAANLCGTVTFRTGCKYEKVATPGTGAGVFKYDAAEDAYVYAGLNDPDADYNYNCSGTKTGTFDAGTNTYSWTNLKSGDYSIEIVPTDSVRSDGKKYTIANIRNNKYVQSLRLGTVDTKFDIPFVEKPASP